MAYRLEPEGSPGKQLARIVRTELRRAADDMNVARRQVDAVHDARKRVKKIRAILRLLRNSLGSAYRTYNKELRTIAHQLSASRDADAALEILKSTQTHYPKQVTRAIFATVRRGLTPEQRGAASRVHATRVRRALRHAATTLPRRVQRAAGPAAVRAGIRLGYSRARRALRDVKATPEDVGFHAWRRRVKDHWYHMRLVEAGHPRLRMRSQRLKTLEHWLGDDHNLVLLRTTLQEARPTFGDQRAATVVLGCIEKYEATLRKRALTLGERLFASKPRAFEKSIR